MWRRFLILPTLGGLLLLGCDSDDPATGGVRDTGQTDDGDVATETGVDTADALADSANDTSDADDDASTELTCEDLDCAGQQRGCAEAAEGDPVHCTDCLEGYTLEGEFCVPEAVCEGPEDCGDPIAGEWGECVFQEECGKSGSRLRSLSIWGCEGGQCVVMGVTDEVDDSSGACLRETEGLACLTGQCAEGVCGPGCVANDHAECFEGDAYRFDSCGERGDLWADCQPTEQCVDDGVLATCIACTPNVYQDCFEGDVYNIDDCGNLGTLADDCLETDDCIDGGTTATCESSCVSHDHEKCLGDDVYWVDSCGRLEDVSVDCGETETCASATAQCAFLLRNGEACETSDECASDHCSNEICSPAEFEYIPPGTFTMGSPFGELGAGPYETRQVEVTLTRGFWMNTTEITQRQWRELMGTDPSSDVACGDDCPVTTINRIEALALANALSRNQGLQECFAFSDCEGLPGTGMVCNVVLAEGFGGDLYACDGYRLPTEAEWEYAYRAGSETPFYGDRDIDAGATDCDDAELAEIAWFCGTSTGVLHEVAQREPNDWGLYDMSGNVFEWTNDQLNYYPEGPLTDPIGTGSLQYVFRGGAFSSNEGLCRAAARSSGRKNIRLSSVGVRLVRSVLD